MLEEAKRRESKKDKVWTRMRQVCADSPMPKFLGNPPETTYEGENSPGAVCLSREKRQRLIMIGRRVFLLPIC